MSVHTLLNELVATLNKAGQTTVCVLAYDFPEDGGVCVECKSDQMEYIVAYVFEDENGITVDW